MKSSMFFGLFAMASIAAALPTVPERLPQAGVVFREDIPEGVKIHEFNEADLALMQAQAEGTSVNPSSASELGLAKRSDCSSGLAVFRAAYPVELALKDPMVAERFPLREGGRSVIEVWQG